MTAFQNWDTFLFWTGTIIGWEIGKAIGRWLIKWSKAA